MSLLSDSMTECQYIDKTTVSDGYGGVETVWTPGAKFTAAFTLYSSLEARRAEQEGVKNLYTIITSKLVTLMRGDVIQRIEDSKYFRITSDGTDDKTPRSAGLDMRKVSAEMLTTLPDGVDNG